MDYKLGFPPHSCGCIVFHVSFLKKVLGDKTPIQTILPEIDEEGKIILELETWIKQLRNRVITEYFIK